MASPQEDALYQALSDADAKGDTKSAQMYAGQIKALRASNGGGAPPAQGGTDSLGGDQNDIGHQIYAGIHNFEDTATFGLGDRVAAAGASALTHLLPVPDQSYSEAYDNIKQTAANAEAGSPITALAGDAAGVLTGGAGIAKLGKVIPAVGRVLEGSADAGRVARVARQAVVGGAFGAADAVGHGENADETLASTAEGVVGGPLLAAAGTAVARRAMSVTSKAMALLAEKIHEPPEILQRFFDTYSSEVGHPPALAEIMDAQSRGELKDLAAGNTTVGTALNAAADNSAANMPTLLGNKIRALSPGGQPENITDLLNTREANMTAAMKPLNDKPVVVNGTDGALLSDPRVRAAFASTSPLRAKLAKVATDTAAGFANNDLTVRDIDQIRQGLRETQAKLLNPTNPMRTANSQTARELGQIADKITQLGSRQYSTYGDALANFGADSDYIHGFKHGVKGGGLGDADAPELIRALGTTPGQKGLASGRASRLFNAATDSDTGAVGVARDLAQQGTIRANTDAFGGHTAADLAGTGETLTRANRSLNEIAPRNIKPQDDSVDVSHLAHGAAALSYHSPTAVGYHISRVFGGKLRMSQGVANKVAEYLTNPKMTQQGINLLKKAGASNADILKLATSISASTGLAAGRTNAESQ